LLEGETIEKPGITW